MAECKHADRHYPKLRCGYPLPCPFHTATIEDGAVFQPVTLKLEKTHIRRLLDIAELYTTEDK